MTNFRQIGQITVVIATSATPIKYSPYTHVALNHNSCRGAADDLLPLLHYIGEHPQCRNVISCYFLLLVQYFIRIFPFNSLQNDEDCSQNSCFGVNLEINCLLSAYLGFTDKLYPESLQQALLVCNRDATLLNDVCALCFR